MQAYPFRLRIRAVPTPPSLIWNILAQCFCSSRTCGAGLQHRVLFREVRYNRLHTYHQTERSLYEVPILQPNSFFVHALCFFFTGLSFFQIHTGLFEVPELWNRSAYNRLWQTSLASLYRDRNSPGNVGVILSRSFFNHWIRCNSGLLGSSYIFSCLCFQLWYVETCNS